MPGRAACGNSSARGAFASVESANVTWRLRGLASFADGFTANDEKPLDRNRHRDENFASRDQVSLRTSADENSCRRGPSNQLQLPVAVECLSQRATSTDPTRGFGFKFLMASSDEVSPIRAKTEVTLTGSPCLRTNHPAEMNIRFRKSRPAYCG